MKRTQCLVEQKDSVWNKGTPMPEDYTCHCGLLVHERFKNTNALHIADCPYAPKMPERQKTG